MEQHSALRRSALGPSYKFQPSLGGCMPFRIMISKAQETMAMGQPKRALILQTRFYVTFKSGLLKYFTIFLFH
jgi:hypothetical protein